MAASGGASDVALTRAAVQQDNDLLVSFRADLSGYLVLSPVEG